MTTYIHSLLSLHKQTIHGPNLFRILAQLVVDVDSDVLCFVYDSASPVERVSASLLHIQSMAHETASRGDIGTSSIWFGPVHE